MALLLGACVSTVTRAFLPSTQNPIYTPTQAEIVLAEYTRLQCAPRRTAQKPDSGSALFAVDVDSLGFATRAELQRATGDEMLDGVFGTVAAQLTFPREGGRRRERVDVDFRCAGDSAHVTVRTLSGKR